MLKKISKKQIDGLGKTLRKKTLVWDALDTKEKKLCFKFNEKYKRFLNLSKTERQAVNEIVKSAKKNGFQDIDTPGNEGGKYFKIFNNKAVALAVTGNEKTSEGINIIGSHLDSPRLDLKQSPLYEEVDLAMMKTHYYGGIKKYHWLARPLAFHGSVVLHDESVVNISIGEDKGDPVFVVSDLLPHLAKDYHSKKVSDAFEAEKLNIITGSLPIGSEENKNRFKLNVLYYLQDKYNITEEDFISAEIEIVPAGSARDIGFDRGLTGGYGQDDRVCAFTSLEALLSLSEPTKTSVAVFFDKEEIGSEGNTGAKSTFFKDFISDLLVKEKSDSSERALRKTLINSVMLSGDVNAAIEPDFQDVHEKSNAARIGYGVCITKFTGSGGKSGSNDADAELVGKIRNIFNDNKIVWQTGELGKTDQGGGGTIAKFLAAYGISIIDCGPSLLSMHAPFEISSKADVYMTYKAYSAFYDR